MGGPTVLSIRALCIRNTNEAMHPHPLSLHPPSRPLASTFMQAALHALAAVCGADRVDSLIRVARGTGEAAGSASSVGHAIGLDASRSADGGIGSSSSSSSSSSSMGGVSVRPAAAVEVDEGAEQRLQRWTFEAARSAAGGPTLAVE